MTNAECQTEGSILTQTEAARGADSLVAFLDAVMPSVEDALRENAASESFRGEETAADDVAATVECVYSLTPYPPDERLAEPNDFWSGLQPTGISWSSSGQG